MQIGDKVKIISYRSSKLEGLSGVITREYKGIFGVMVEGHKNHNSQYGCYWLRKSQIILFEIEESEDEEMFGDYKTVQVSFLNDNEKEQVCMSKYAMYDNFEVGDVVVVKTGHHGLAVAKIASIDDTVSRVAIKSVCTWVNHLIAEDEEPVTFVNYADFADQILDVFQSIQGAIEVEVDYKADAFNPITIKEVFDC